MTWLMPSTSMPRATMSVATSTLHEPRLNSFERLDALRLRAVAVDRGAAHAGAVERVRDPVGAVLGAGEDEHALEAVRLDHVQEQVALLRARDRVERLRRSPRSAVEGGETSMRAGSTSVSPMTLSTSGVIVAEKSSVWRLAGSSAMMRRTSGQKPMVEHAVRLVEHEDLDLLRST